MKFKKGDEIVVVGYNPSNSTKMTQELETDFPVGTVHKVLEITRCCLTKTAKDRLNGKINCSNKDMEFCKKSSETQCIKISNPYGECIYNNCTHICYVQIEKLEK